LLRHKLVDFDCALALDGDCLKLFGLDLDVLSFADFVALDDVGNRGGPVFRDRMAAWLRWFLGLITPPVSPAPCR
jgi:hypothetical protein